MERLVGASAIPSLRLFQRALAHEKLENRSLLTTLVGLAVPLQPTASKPGYLEFRFASDNTSGQLAARQTFGFSALENIPGQIRDRAFAGDWNGTGYSSIGVARLTPTLQANRNDWVFQLATDGDEHSDFAFRFGDAFDASVVELPVPLVGNFDGKNGTDVAIARKVGGRWSWELSWSSASYPEPECELETSTCRPDGLPPVGFPGGNKLKPTPTLATNASLVFGNVEVTALTIWSRPVVGDFNLDGRDDIAIATLQRDASPSNSGKLEFSYLASASKDKPFQSAAVDSQPTGTRSVLLSNLPSDFVNAFVVFGDWNNDTKNDIGLVIDNGSNLRWTKIDSQATSSNLSEAFRYGSSGDQPVSGNWADSQWTSTIPISTSPFLVDPVTGLIVVDPITGRGLRATRSRFLQADKWNSRAVPAQSKNVVIDNTASGTIVIDGPLIRTGETRIANDLTIVSDGVEFSGKTTLGKLSIENGSVKFQGPTTISTLQVNGEVEIDAPVNSSVTIGAINIGVNGNLRLKGAIVAPPAINVNGGAIEFATNSPLSNSIINVGTAGATFSAALANNGATFSNPIVLAANAIATFDWIGAASSSIGFAYAGSITGQGSVRKRGLGFLNLISPSLYLGSTLVEAGELRLGGPNILPTTTDVTVNAGAFFNLSTNSQTVRSIAGAGNIQGDANSKLSISGAGSDFSGRFTNSLAVSKEGTQTLTLRGNSTNTGPWTIVGGTLQTVGDSVMPDTASIDVQTGATFDASLSNDTITSISIDAGGTALLGSTNATTYQVLGNITNRSGGRVQTGASRLRVVGDLDNQGSFLSSGGTLEMAGNTVLQNLRLGTSGLATLQHSGSQRLLVQSSVSNVNFTGSVINDAGEMDLSGLRFTAPNLELNAGSFRGNDTSRMTIASNIDVIAGSIGVSLAGSGRLRKTGSGTVDLTAVNSFTGEVNIVQGTLSTGVSNTLPPTPVTVQTGATLLLNNNSQLIAGLSGAGQVQLGTGTLTVQALNPSSFDGLINGTGKIQKTGNGLWTLRTANSFTGGVDVLDGSLQAEAADALGTGPVLVQSTGTLNIVGQQTISRLTNAGTLNLTTTTVRFSGNFTNSGVLNPSNSTLETIGTTALQTIDLGASIGGSILVSGLSPVQLNSSSTNLTLNTVTVRGGSLELGAKTMVVQALVLNSANATIQGTGSIDSASPLDLRAGTISVPLVGAAGARKSTIGTVNFNLANTYRGSTIVEQGLLDVRVSGGLGSGSVNIGSAGTLRLVGIQAITGADISGTLEAPNATIQLSGNLNNFGSMAVGTLETVRSDQTSLRIDLGASSTVTNLTTTGASPVQLVTSASNVSIPGTLLLRSGSMDVAEKNVFTNQLRLEGGDSTELKGTGTVTSTSAYDLRTGILSIALAGAAGLRKSTNGTVALNVTNSFTGPVEIQSGVLRANASNSIQGAVSILANASLDLHANQQVSTLTNSGTLAANNSTIFLSGNFTNSGLFQAGTSTLVAAAPTPQTIDLGANQAHHLNMSSSSPVRLVSTGPNITLTGTLSLRGGVLNVDALPVNTQAFVLDGNINTVIHGTRELTSLTTYDVRGGVIDIELAGPAGLRKTTSGSVRIDVPSTYQGSTSIVEGTLNANTANAVSTQSPVRVETNGTVNLNSFSAAIQSLSNGGNVVLGEAELSIANDLTNDAEAKFDSGNASIALAGNLSNSGDWPSRGAKLNWTGTGEQQSLQSGGAAFASMNHSGSSSLLIVDDAVVDGEFSQSGGNLQLSDGGLVVGTLTWKVGQLSRSNDTSALRIQELASFESGQINAPISGGNAWTKTSNGKLSFTAPINYATLLQVDAGIFEVTGQSSLPEGRDLSVGASGNLHVNAGTASFANIQLAGRLELGTATLQINPIARSNSPTTLLATVTGTAVGSNGLIKRGALPLAWSGPNEISGEYRIAEGELQLLGDAALHSTSTLRIISGGRVRLGQHSVSNQAISGEGELILDSGAVLQTLQGNFDGTLSGVGTIRKVGDGELHFTSGSHGEFGGTIEVQVGTLRVNGNMANANTKVGSGSNLAGGGTLHDVEIMSGGLLNPGNSPGTMHVQTLNLASGSTLVIEIDGRAAGTQYDQLVVNGQADLSGTILVRISNALKESLTSVDVFDLIKYSSVIGQPMLEVQGIDGVIRVVESRLPNSYRLNIQILTPFVIVPVEGGPGNKTSDSGFHEGETKSIRFVSAGVPEESQTPEDGPSDINVSLGPETSNWLNESENISPIFSPPVTDQPIDIAALDSALAEGLSLDLQMIVSDARPLTPEQAAGILLPTFDSLADLPELPEWTPGIENFSAKILAASGIAATLLGSILSAFGIMATRRRRFLKLKGNHEDPLNTRLNSFSGQGTDRKPELPNGTNPRRNEAWTTD